MTYCVAVGLQAGLVLCSDSRTSAGADQVSTYSKMHRFQWPDRLLVLLSSGNLGTTQAVVSQLRRATEADGGDSLRTLGGLHEVAEHVGQVSVEQQNKHSNPDGQSSFSPDASFLLAGQIRGEPPGVYLVYPQGNFITPSEATPYLQIGETKYGKPILDRMLTPQTSLDDAAKCVLVSMDSTMRSNATVGPPVELLSYAADSFAAPRYLKLDADSEQLLALRRHWAERIAEAMGLLPPVRWDG